LKIWSIKGAGLPQFPIGRQIDAIGRHVENISVKSVSYLVRSGIFEADADEIAIIRIPCLNNGCYKHLIRMINICLPRGQAVS
jgi:hypothetical protein